MALNSSREAVREARRLLGLAPGEEGTAYRVRRLDKTGTAYFLVFTENHVACLDAVSGELLATARTSRSPVTVTDRAAIERTAMGADATAELVWAPGMLSQSMFDPLWAITAGGQTLYVDQRGGLWNELRAKRPGGG